MKPSNKKKTTKVQGLRACEPFPEVAVRASKVMRRVPHNHVKGQTLRIKQFGHVGRNGIPFFRTKNI
jgi:hypothetical protein